MALKTSRQMIARAAFILAASTVVVAVAAPDPTALLQPVKKLSVTGKFQGPKKKKPAKDLSGVACFRLDAGSSRCLALDDETTTVQFTTVTNGGIAVDEDDFELFGKSAPDDVIGTAPEMHECADGKKKFKDLDGEAVAFDGKHFYVTGSHGCSRNSDSFRPSAFLLARLGMDKTGMIATNEVTYRLADILPQAPAVGSYFGKTLKEGMQGLNVEGIAVAGDRIAFGLRAPSIDGNAFIVSAPVEALFAPEGATDVSAVTTHAIGLGPNAGIRDMTMLPDGRLLVLAGPTLEQGDVPFSIHVSASGIEGPYAHLATFPEIPDGKDIAKPEAIGLLGVGEDGIRLLVLFDGPDNGAPREYLVPLP